MTKRKAFGISRDLNEGISQTINAVKNNAGQLRYEIIPLVKIKLDPQNPRKLALTIKEVQPESTLAPEDPMFEQKRKELESLKSLASSIKKQGVRNAVEVYKDGIDYRLISGERRVLASILAGKEDVQARIVDVKPCEFDIRYLQWIENIEREDLCIWDRIENVRQLIATHTQMTQTQVTATVLKEILGCSLPHAMTYLAVVNAPADIQDLLRDNIITNLEKAAFLAKIEDNDLRATLVKASIEDNRSLAVLKKLLSDMTKPSLSKTPQERKPGRQAKRVSLGYTHDITVARELIETMVAKHKLSNLEHLKTDTNWDDCTSVSKAFALLLKTMERTHSSN